MQKLVVEFSGRRGILGGFRRVHGRIFSKNRQKRSRHSAGAKRWLEKETKCEGKGLKHGENARKVYEIKKMQT